MLTLADAIEALTTTRPPRANMVITEAAIDSRQVIPGALFVAIPGEHADGHDFVTDAFQRGASCALIQSDIPENYQTVDLERHPGLSTFPIVLKHLFVCVFKIV